MTTTLDRARTDTVPTPDSKTISTLALIAVAGVVGDLAMHASAFGFAASGAVAALGWCAASGSASLRRPATLVVPMTITALALWLSVRYSPWLLTIDLAAAALLLMIGPAIDRQGRLLANDRYEWTLRSAKTFRAIQPALVKVVRIVHRATAALAGGRAAALGLGNYVLAAATGALMLVLLASGDAVFASFLSMPDVTTQGLHLLGWSVATFVGLWLATASDHHDRPARAATAIRTSHDSASLLLATVSMVLGLFTLSQLVTVLQGRQWVLERTGLTFAEYARQGFFQLLWVAVVVAAVLAFARVRTAADYRRPPRRVIVLTGVIAALTIGLVIVSLRRMFLYEEAFGLTMLRLYVMGFAAWMIAVLLATATATASAGGRRWLAPFVVGSAVAGVLVLNIVNPEAIVVERNLERAQSGADLDVDYLLGMSTDGRLALVEALEAGQWPAITRALCERGLERTPDLDNIWSYNFSVDHYQEAVARLCGSGPS
ncbi:MAG: DUF4173 domain-containing protein [Acidimicrobiales bacterium]|nr:DUF4173 domain-containing protein [Acidimicrobiales bacterium]